MGPFKLLPPLQPLYWSKSYNNVHNIWPYLWLFTCPCFFTGRGRQLFKYFWVSTIFLDYNALAPFKVLIDCIHAVEAWSSLEKVNVYYCSIPVRFYRATMYKFGYLLNARDIVHTVHGIDLFNFVSRRKKEKRSHYVETFEQIKLFTQLWGTISP